MATFVPTHVIENIVIENKLLDHPVRINWIAVFPANSRKHFPSLNFSDSAYCLK